MTFLFEPMLRLADVVSKAVDPVVAISNRPFGESSREPALTVMPEVSPDFVETAKSMVSGGPSPARHDEHARPNHRNRGGEASGELSVQKQRDRR